MKVEILPNGTRLVQRDGVLKLGLDAMSLADFSRPASGDTVCDLGAGAGAITLLLADAHPRLNLTAVEFYPPAYELLTHNIQINDLSSRITPLFCDLRNLPKNLRESFDGVVSNPPYHRWVEGQAAPATPERSDKTASPTEVCAAAAHLLKNGGRFWLVIRTDRLAEYMHQLVEHNLQPKRLHLVSDALALIESRKNGKPGLRLGI